MDYDTMPSENDFIKMLDLDLTIPNEFSNRTLDIRKFNSRIHKKAKENAKLDHCIICGKQCTSFCKSHSVPQFALKAISNNGKVCQTIPDMVSSNGQEIGIGKAGTFFIICNNCDNTRFQQYESLDSYNAIPSDRVLSQIALKNFIQMLSKRNEEGALYSLLGARFEHAQAFTDEKQIIGELDKQDYINGFYHSLKSVEDDLTRGFHLYYYQHVNYVVPYAMQAAIALKSDMEDNVINDSYNYSEKYHLEFLHLAVFPLKESSVILAFVENGCKRYRKFFKQFNKLSTENKLSVINYIIFLYSENVFINPDVAAELSKNKAFMDVCRRTDDAISPVMFVDPLPVAVREHSLRQHSSIPNLLSEQYAIH